MGRWLGLDIGERRIGVALSDETRTLARPLLTLTRASKRADFAQVLALCRAHQIDLIVAGLPKTLRNEEGPQARRVRRYVEELSAAVGVPVAFCDERFSSVEAQERLAAGGRRARTRGDIDSAAAAVILQAYINAGRPADY